LSLSRTAECDSGSASGLETNEQASMSPGEDERFAGLRVRPCQEPFVVRHEAASEHDLTFLPRPSISFNVPSICPTGLSAALFSVAAPVGRVRAALQASALRWC
jgi:hypothetical protein